MVVALVLGKYPKMIDYINIYALYYKPCGKCILNLSINANLPKCSKVFVIQLDSGNKKHPPVRSSTKDRCSPI